MKELLVVYYTQSGQLKEVLDNLVLPLQNDNQVNLHFYKIEPKKDFPFPWVKKDFFNAFPESFQQIPVELEAPGADILNVKYDLVILAYQVWYLSPSIPINSFLKTQYASQLLKDRPVITVSGSRNMWVMAQEKIKKLLRQNDAHLVGNIALADRHANLISVITIVDWMFSGKKRKHFGFLPLPGIAVQEMKESVKFGVSILEFLKQEKYDGLQAALLQKKAVEIHSFLVSIDKKANRMFEVWSKLILKNDKRRTVLLRLFNYYLFIAIWFVSPIVHLVHLFLSPLMYFKRKKEKKYFQGID